MEHQYDFYEATVVDEIVGSTWQQFIERFPSRWAANTEYEAGGYYGESLRGLIAFSIDPTPRRATVERIIATESVKATSRRAAPQSFFLAELMRQLGRTKAVCWTGDIRDVTPIIGAATMAFLDDRIPEQTFAAVVKLHRCDPREWLRLSRTQQHAVGGGIAKIRFQTPVFSWQRRNAFGDEERTDGLGVDDTRLFLQFVADAWKYDWPTGRPRADVRPDLGKFPKSTRAAPGFKALAAVARKVRGVASPCVVRTWE